MSASTFTSAETSAVDQTSRVISTSTSDADVSISKSRAQSRGSITSISTSVQPSISTQRHSIGTSAHAQPSNSTSHHSSMSFAPSSSTNDPNVSIPPSTSSISSSESRDRNSGPHLSFSTFVWGNFFNHHLSDSQRHAVASSTTSRTESEDCDCEDTTSATSTSASGVWISKPVESSTTSWSRQAPASSSAAPPPSSRQSFSAPPTSSAAPPPPPPPPPPPTPSTSQHTVQTSTSTWSQQSTTSSSAQLSTTTITDTFVFTDGSTTIGQFNPTGSVPGGGGSGGSNDNNGGLDLLGLLMAPPKEYPTKPIESDPSYPTAQPAEDVVHSTSSLSLRPSTSSEGNEIDPQSSLTPEFPKTTSDTIAVQTEQIDPSESIATWIVALLRGARSENPGVAGIDDARLMRRFWPGGRGGGRVFGGEQRPADQASVDSYRPNSEPENSEGQESGYGPGEKPFKQQERKKCPRRRSRETREEDVKRLCVRGM
ncbi:hypothetical protein BD324DRAFT_622799 [Kockovaella imperatae]|uniref:Uncharacterized protein n=1 Tax=Kockovaella imperatae TaxID=4999 RepID=A0A1Y1UHX2_9TREE|nr:hypothetical protein BD324DRAFT_622799 [Kockovaella imperatae]ORX37660.1 hypothetical protein BD324DRAFT_622799 [Kockovaella imperatae]